MAKKRREAVRRWWRRRRVRRRLAVLGVLALAVGILAWLILRGQSDSGREVYLREPAPPFTLPTVAGEPVSLSDHVGRHNLILYFNEGMG